MAASNVTMAASNVTMEASKQYANAVLHSWNTYRYIGDGLHNIAIVFFSLYLTAHKLFYLFSSLLALVAFGIFLETYERGKDTGPFWILVVPAFVAACITANELVAACITANEVCGLETFWIFSHFLEGVAMVPQYVFSYRDAGSMKIGVVCYMMSMGLYRTFYLLNWIHKFRIIPFYWDIISWVGGILNISLFIDYVCSRMLGFSFLRRLTLGVDDRMGLASSELQKRLRDLLLPVEDVDWHVMELGASNKTVAPSSMGVHQDDTLKAP